MCTDHTPGAILARTTGRRALLAGTAGALGAVGSAAVGAPATASSARGLSATGSPATAPGASAPEAAPASWPRRGAVRDLTHELTTRFPTYSTGEEARRRTVVTIEDDGFYLQRWRLYEHTGTHVDAPGHFVAGARLGPELRPRELVRPAVVVDISGRAARNPDTTVTVADLRRFERRHGRIPRRAAVLMHSGWARKVDDPDTYRGVDAAGTLHFPGFGAEATRWLVERRGVTAIGVDTLSTDPGISTTFDTHVILAEADGYGIENLARLGSLPPVGATIMVGMLSLQEGSGGPARVLAMA